MATRDEEVAAAFLQGALRAGVDTCIYLPDSCLTGITHACEASQRIAMIPCAREDEGMAIAVGLYLSGRNPVCMMEASGIGYSGLILARAQMQRTPVVVVASHTGGAGEGFDYHGPSFMLAEGIFKGLGIPYEIANESRAVDSLIYGVVQTARGQRTSFGLLIPPYLVGAEA